MTNQTDAQSVTAHYTHDANDLGPAILAALRAAAPHRDALTLEDLAPIDQFHAGGIQATRALARLAAPQAGARVLDVGGGLGGPARTLAQEFGCTVTVLDLTEAFCRAGAFLTAQVGLSDQVTFQQGDALDLPFSDGSFDLVWIQHASMNIADKERLYAELGRVLRPGGRLALYEVMVGEVAPPYFPVPWAQDPALSFLRPPAAIRALLADLGFHEVAWVDVTVPMGAALRASAAPPDRAASPPPDLSVVMGAAFPQMRANFARNIVEGRVALIQAVCEWIQRRG
jgi:SAM-dependent methyltransferase